MQQSIFTSFFDYSGIYESYLSHYDEINYKIWNLVEEYYNKDFDWTADEYQLMDKYVNIVQQYDPEFDMNDLAYRAVNYTIGTFGEIREDALRDFIEWASWLGVWLKSSYCDYIIDLYNHGEFDYLSNIYDIERTAQAIHTLGKFEGHVTVIDVLKKKIVYSNIFNDFTLDVYKDFEMVAIHNGFAYFK